MKTSTIALKGFNYNGLTEKATRAALRSEATAIKSAFKRSHDNIVEIGNRLNNAKELLEHGLFMNWLDAEFQMEYRTAKRFMEVSEAFGKIDIMSNLPLSQTALYALSAPSVSEAIRVEAIELAQAGEITTVADTKAFIESKKAEVLTNEILTFVDGDRVTWEGKDKSPKFGIFRSARDKFPTQAVIEREDGQGVYHIAFNRLSLAVNEESEPEAAVTEIPVTEPAAPVPASSGGYSTPDEAGTSQADMAPELDGESAPVTNNAAPESSTTDASKTDGADGEKPKEPNIEEKVEALPLYQALALHGHGAQLFREQALIYHNVEKVINSARAKKTLLEYKTGPVSDAISAVAKLPSPEFWEGCATCKGTTRVGERFDPCPRCKGGFTIHKSEGVSADVIRANAPQSDS